MVRQAEKVPFTKSQYQASTIGFTWKAFFSQDDREANMFVT